MAYESKDCAEKHHVGATGFPKGCSVPIQACNVFKPACGGLRDIGAFAMPLHISI